MGRSDDSAGDPACDDDVPSDEHLEREAAEVRAAVLLVATGRAVSVTVTDVIEALVLLDRLKVWAEEQGVELVRIAGTEGPEAILARRHR